MRMTSRLAILVIAAVLALSGCQREEVREQQAEVSPPAPVARKEPRVVVPDEVKGKWKAVKIAVVDKEGSKEEIYTVDIGSEFSIAGSDISLLIRNFLPSFIMDGTTMTSASNETRNPAAQIVINEKGKPVFRGWLFSLYPGTHAFQHPRYSFTLVDFVPAESTQAKK